jgi:hypothetical protein
VLHRQNPTVLEMTDFEGLFRCRKSVAEREGFPTPIAKSRENPVKQGISGKPGEEL